MPSLQEKQLFQSSPSGTTIASVYSPADNTTTIIRTIYVANVHASNTPTFQICVDDNGTTYTASTALYWNKSTTAADTIKLETFIVMNNSSGNIAFRTSGASELTITGFGVEITP